MSIQVKTTLEAFDSAIRFRKDIALTNSKSFRIAKASATSKAGNEKACQELETMTTPSLSLTTTPITHLSPSIGSVVSTLSL